MTLGDRIRRTFGAAGGPIHPDGVAELHVGDAGYDDWDVVQDFDDLETARAWRQQLTDAGMEAVLTADWPVNEFGKGDIALRVPHGRGPDAEDMLNPP